MAIIRTGDPPLLSESSLSSVASISSSSVVVSSSDKSIVLYSTLSTSVNSIRASYLDSIPDFKTLT